MAGLEVTPDKKFAYTVIAQRRSREQALRVLGVRSHQRPDHAEGRGSLPHALQLGISTDGKKLYIYGAGFDIEVYDAATLKYEKTWDLNNDVTYAGIVVIHRRVAGAFTCSFRS